MTCPAIPQTFNYLHDPDGYFRESNVVRGHDNMLANSRSSVCRYFEVVHEHHMLGALPRVSTQPLHRRVLAANNDGMVRGRTELMRAQHWSHQMLRVLQDVAFEVLYGHTALVYLTRRQVEARVVPTAPDGGAIIHVAEGFPVPRT